MIVLNLRLGAVWTDLKESDLQSDFFFKAGGDGVALPIRGYEDASVEAVTGPSREAEAATVRMSFRLGSTPQIPLQSPTESAVAP